MIELWKQLDDNKITATQVRLHIGLARTVLETLKVEMAASHLNQTRIAPVSIAPDAIRFIREVEKPGQRK
jgi:hypothetical protein